MDDAPTIRRSSVADEVAAALGDPAARVGKYVRLRELGRGGFGSVWLAWDTELSRRVALKFLNAQSAEDLERFAREARTAGRLAHANIVPVYDVGEADGRRFIAMEYVEGAGADKLAMTPREAVELVRQAADALAYAHAQGVIHRDVKPANLLVSRGKAFVADFGLAKPLTGDASISASGAVLGTPNYMAPEQVKGQAVGPATDVWGLGATLYALLAHAPPFAGRDVVETLSRVVDAELTPPAGERDLQTIVMKCLEKDASRRYASAAELRDDLARWLAGDPIAARPASAIYRLRKRIAKRRYSYALGAALVLMAIIAASLFVVLQVVAKEEAERLQMESHRRMREMSRNEFVTSTLMGLLELENALAEPEAATADVGGRLARMLQRLRLGLMDFPGDARLHANLGWANRLAGRYEEAEAAYTRAVELAPEDGASWFERGRIRFRLRVADARAVIGRHFAPGRERPDRMKGALEDFEKAEAFGVRTGDDGLLARASAHFGKKEVDDGIRLCEERIARGGRTEEFHFLMATAQYSAQRTEDAKASLKAALQSHPNHLDALDMLGDIHNQSGNAELALDTYARIQAFNPLYGKSYINRAGLLYRLGRKDEALAEMDRGIEADPSEPMAFYNRANLRMERGNFRGAVDDATEVIRLDPAYIEAYLIRARGLEGLGDRRAAIGDCERAAAIDPAFAVPFVHLGLLQERAEESADALEAFLKAAKRAPENLDVLLLIGRLHARCGRFEQALDAFNRAHALNPREPNVLFLRADTKAALKDFKGAIADAEAALECAPEEWAERENATHRLEHFREASKTDF